MEGELSSDLALLEAWQAGDAGAGDILVRRYYRAVLRFLELRTPAAEDLTQRTFLACVEGRERFRRECSFRSYLFSIAYKLLLKQIDRQAGERRRARFDDDAPGRTTTVSALMARRQEQRMLLAVLSTLEERDQTLLMLHYWENLTSREIGDVLGCPTSTVTSALSRARASLRRRVGQLIQGTAGAAVLEDLERWTRSLAGPVPAAEDVLAPAVLEQIRRLRTCRS